MKIAVTAANGQLGSSIVNHLKKEVGEEQEGHQRFERDPTEGRGQSGPRGLADAGKKGAQ